jgi:hypothetical protein
MSSRRQCSLVLERLNSDDLRELAIWRQPSRHNLVFGRSFGSDHDAAMRIGGEAPGGAHSSVRLEGQE